MCVLSFVLQCSVQPLLIKVLHQSATLLKHHNLIVTCVFKYPKMFCTVLLH